MLAAFTTARRRGWIVATMAAAVSGAPASAQESEAVQQARSTAYAAAMKCFVVDTRLSALRLRAGDRAKSAYYDEKSRQSFDTAVKLGQRLNRSKDEIERDFNVVQVRELPELLRSEAYLRDAIATCKALGLT